MNLAAVILAAGQGTRMKSNRPKVLHPVAGKPMVTYAVEAVRALGSKHTVLVVGHEAEQVRQVVQAAFGEGVEFVVQQEQRGTGHAVLQVRGLLQGQADTVVVTYGDMPLLQESTLNRLGGLHVSSGATVTMLTVLSDDSMGFGRIL